jgi:hypothetical protein
VKEGLTLMQSGRVVSEAAALGKNSENIGSRANKTMEGLINDGSSLLGG